MDWSRSSDIEVVKRGGRSVPVVLGTDISPADVLSAYKVHTNLSELRHAFPQIPELRLRSVLDYGLERIGWDTPTLVDWRGCELVEQVPGKLSGAPTVVGTRVTPDTIAQLYFDGYSAEQIVEDYPTLSRGEVMSLIRWVQLKEASAA